MRCELAEVLRSRVRVDDATTRQAREADVGKRGERFSITAHLLECRKRREQPCAVVGADRRHVQLREALGSLAGADAGQCLPALVERQHRDDRQVRHAADRLDRVDDLVEIVERLDREEIRAATVENRRLFCEELAPHATRRRLADRPDRTCDEDVTAAELARIPCELDAGRVDPFEIVLEEVVRELAPVCAERVRLDQLRAGIDEARVERDHGFGRSEICLLRTAETWHCCGEQRAHPPVAHDHGPSLEAL